MIPTKDQIVMISNQEGIPVEFITDYLANRDYKAPTIEVLTRLLVNAYFDI